MAELFYGRCTSRKIYFLIFAVGYTYIPFHEFVLQCLFLYVRTLQIQFRKRAISLKNTGIFGNNTFAKLDL